MKKVIRITLAFLIFTIVGCDFLRNFAGRPIEAQIEAKAAEIRARRQARIDDSLALVREKLRQRDSVRQDSLLFAGALRDRDVRMSSVFRFGKPVEPLACHYNIIIGVYRVHDTANKLITDMKEKGFSSFPIMFPGGEIAVALGGSDTLSVVVHTVDEAKALGAFPKGTWVYVNK